jgi:hypothetical protein
MRNAPVPWKRDAAPDPEGYPVIRDARQCPVAVVDRTLDVPTQERIAGMILAAPALTNAMREIIFSQDAAVDWDEARWARWRHDHGQAIALAMGMIDER